MTLIKIIFLTILCPLFVSLQGMEMGPLSSEKAIELVTHNIEWVLDSMIEEDPRVRGGRAFKKPVVRFDWLPGYIVKLNSDRIWIAENIVTPCIMEEKLDLLRVPKMWRVPIPPKSTLSKQLEKVWFPEDFCLAEYIPGTLHNEMSVDQTKQMVTLLTKAARTFVDCKSDNFVFSNGKLCIIDTESRGFEKNRIEFGLLQLYQNNNFCSEAKEYLKKEFKDRFNKEIG